MEKGGLATALGAVGLTRARRVGCADELRLGLRGTTRPVWGRRGLKVRQRLPLTDQWRSLVAAVDGQTGRVWWDGGPTMQAAARWPTLAGLQAMSVREGLVWDRAPSHRDADSTDLALALVPLPPYRPELNPAERLLEAIRRHLAGKVYATLADQGADVEAFLAELDADPVRVRRRCGWDWITAALATLPAPQEKAA